MVSPLGVDVTAKDAEIEMSAVSALSAVRNKANLSANIEERDHPGL